MTDVCEAVYENGVFKPTVAPSNIKEGQRVNIVCDDMIPSATGALEDAQKSRASSYYLPPEEPFEMKPAEYATPEEIMNALQSMYDGWSQEEIKDFESIILDRSNFRKRRD